MKDDPSAARVYRSLLGLYPREFRDEYGADMEQMLRDQLVDEPAWRVCARAALDLAITIPTQQLETHMNRTSSTHLVPLLYAALAFGGLLGAIVGGSNAPIVATGLSIAAVAATTAAVARARSGPTARGISTDGWWKLVLAGPCIVVAVVVAGVVGVDAWLVGMFVVLVAFAMTGTGVVLGIARIARRHSRVTST